jgi:hypothetical protein
MQTLYSTSPNVRVRRPLDKYSYIHEHRTCADCAFKPLDEGGEYAFGTKVKVGTEWVVRCVWYREVKRGVEAEGCNCEEICAYRLCGCKNPCLTCSTDRGGRCQCDLEPQDLEPLSGDEDGVEDGVED